MITVGSDGISDSDETSYTFQVIVSDGVSANNQYITATVTVDVNESTEIVADEDLPANVVAGMIDHDSDDATAMVEGYKIVVSVTDGDVPMTLVNLGDLVVDADVNDVLKFDVSGNPSHVVYDDATNNMELTYLPPGADLTPRVDVITVGVSDGFQRCGRRRPDTLHRNFGNRGGAGPDHVELRGHNGCGKLDRLLAGRRSQRLLGGGHSARRNFLQY